MTMQEMLEVANNAIEDNDSGLQTASSRLTLLLRHETSTFAPAFCSSVLYLYDRQPM
jgi:hypothetical protein